MSSCNISVGRNNFVEKNMLFELHVMWLIMELSVFYYFFLERPCPDVIKIRSKKTKMKEKHSLLRPMLKNIWTKRCVYDRDSYFDILSRTFGILFNFRLGHMYLSIISCCFFANVRIQSTICVYLDMKLIEE